MTSDRMTPRLLATATAPNRVSARHTFGVPRGFGPLLRTITAFCLLLSAALATQANAAQLTGIANPKKSLKAAPAANPRVRIETTKGVIVVEVFPDKAPLSAANFLKLVDDGFYNGLVFHRVVANFVIQTGGYDAKLTYRTPPGTVVNESTNGLRNKRGTLAMARQTDPDSADAQFFINMRDNPHLDPVGDRAGYAVFGKVIAGMEAAERIELSDTSIQAGMAGVPEHPIEIIAVSRVDGDDAQTQKKTK